MAVQIDRLTSVGLAKEGTRGTAATPTHWLPHQEVTIQDRVEKAIDNSGIGRIEEAFDAEVTSKWADGTLSGNVYADSVGLLLYNLFGAVNSTQNADGSGNVYDHTFSVGNTNTHQSLTVAVKDANEDLEYARGMINSLEFTAELNQFVRYSAEFNAAASADEAGNTASFSAEPRFRPQDITVKMADSVAELSGEDAIKLRMATIGFTQNTENDFALGSVDVDEIYNKQWGVSISLEALYRDNTWVELIRNGSKKALSIALVNSDVTIGSAANPSLTFTFEPGHFNPRELSGGLDDLKTETLEMQGLFNIDESQMVEAVLTNLETSY